MVPKKVKHVYRYLRKYLLNSGFICVDPEVGCTEDRIFFAMVDIGSQPSDHYFRSVCLFVSLSVCLCRVFLSGL